MRLPLSSPSLVRRLIWTLVGSLTVVALLLGAGGAWLIHGIVEHTNDRLLGASARAIAETLAVEDGEVTLDLPRSALGMLENNERDNIYYSVRQNGALLTGYPDLVQAPPQSLRIDSSEFRYDTFRGLRIRVAAETRTLPRIPGVIVVQVAETLDSRRTLANRMMLGLAALEGVLILIAGLLVWPAVRWSLGPVTRLREQMDARPADQADFTPLSLQGVPVELVGLVSGFNALLGRLEAAVEGIRRFTADASHQMRTPLAVLRTHLAVVQKHGTRTEAGRASLEDIEGAVIRLQGLLTGLIALARTEDILEAGEPPPVDVRLPIHNAVEELRDAAAARRVSLLAELPGEPAFARIEPLLVSEMVRNLVDNAIRYNHQNGQVTVRVLLQARDVRIEVEDTGPGVPPEQRDKIFQRFFRLPRDQQRSGSGLGLSIVEAIARRSGATLTVNHGAAGVGLQVAITLPSAIPPPSLTSRPRRGKRARAGAA